MFYINIIDTSYNESTKRGCETVDTFRLPMEMGCINVYIVEKCNLVEKTEENMHKKEWPKGIVIM